MTPEKRWTVRSMREWCRAFFERHHIDAPSLEAELLLAHALDLRRIELFMQMDRPMIPSELTAFKALVQRRAKHEPLAYITGQREFWSLPLHVSPAVLIPRPETELLVERALKHLRTLSDPMPCIADIGTGSGAIALALASELPDAIVWASDLSHDALDVARLNAQRHKLDARVHFLQGDLLEPLPPAARPLDLIVSNPPYVALHEADQLAPELSHEPQTALFSGPRGLDVIQRLIPQAFAALTSGGALLCEIGAPQGDDVARLFSDAGFSNVQVFKDLAQIDRVVQGLRP